VERVFLAETAPDWARRLLHTQETDGDWEGVGPPEPVVEGFADAQDQGADEQGDVSWTPLVPDSGLLVADLLRMAGEPSALPGLEVRASVAVEERPGPWGGQTYWLVPGERARVVCHVGVDGSRVEVEEHGFCRHMRGEGEGEALYDISAVDNIRVEAPGARR
jgi:hypothetical protein